jgi:hypothetical protein
MDIDRPETYAEQLAAFKERQKHRQKSESFRRAEALAAPPSPLDNGSIYAQCPRCKGAKMHNAEVLCAPCRQERDEKWVANVEEERRLMSDGLAPVPD